MKQKLAGSIAVIFTSVALYAQESVCDLFKDLKAADGRQLILTGELILSKDWTVLGAADCDYKYNSPTEVGGLRVSRGWPTALHLSPSAIFPAKQLQELDDAVLEADRLRRAGKVVSASAAVSGRIRLVPAAGFPAQLIFDSIENLKVEALPDPGELPVIPICELFQNLPAWKGKRIAVRGESVGTSEGSWVRGRCKGSFYTNGYRWPVALSYAVPAYYSSSIEHLVGVKRPVIPLKGEASLKGRNNVVRSATYVGRLQMRSEYIAQCREDGSYLTNGFGHLNGSAAAFLVEDVMDVELTPRVAMEEDEADEQPSCKPENFDFLCSGATSLLRAASMGCVNRVRELLSKEGIDSKDGNESAALSAAIRRGDEALVRVLLEAGAPVNPAKMRLWPPLAEAANGRKIAVMKLLLQAGAKVDGLDNDGVTCLTSSGFFDTRITKILLEAGANPNATDRHGATALMRASGYGYESAVKLLIGHGAEVNLKDGNGRDALMHAVAGEYVDAIPLLLAGGADLYARDREGKTALEIARRSKNQVAVQLLSAALKNVR